jgi:hypothetical protein
MLRMYENVPVKVYYKSSDVPIIYKTNPKLTFTQKTIPNMLMRLFEDYIEEMILVKVCFKKMDGSNKK